MSYLMSGMYALPLCVPINRAYKEADLGLVTHVLFVQTAIFTPEAENGVVMCWLMSVRVCLVISTIGKMFLNH